MGEGVRWFIAVRGGINVSQQFLIYIHYDDHIFLGVAVGGGKGKTKQGWGGRRNKYFRGILGLVRAKILTLTMDGLLVIFSFGGEEWGRGGGFKNSTPIPPTHIYNQLNETGIWGRGDWGLLGIANLK